MKNESPLAPPSLEQVLAGLRAAGEDTRLRLLALCARGDLTVSDLVRILGQSQPRISRHLKVLCESGLLDRLREGSWVFYRLALDGPGAVVARRVLGLLPDTDPTLTLDRQRLAAVQSERATHAAGYFAENAERWDAIRSLHVDEAEVEALLLNRLGDAPLGELVDVGTGTGRMLTLLGPKASRALGVDQSREMLTIARAALEHAGLRHAVVRQGDMYALPLADASADTVLVHQVLHYAEHPAAVLAEAARVLRPGGRLCVVDFAPHDLETLRDQHSHRRLGFADGEVAEWCVAAGLVVRDIVPLPGRPLTVTVWLAAKPAACPASGEA
ncbi:MAG: metalloregulator ArsR/SmtB family transcription factor [Rhodospirillaceae bacterium]